jgi:hypothetical protein
MKNLFVATSFAGCLVASSAGFCFGNFGDTDNTPSTVKNWNEMTEAEQKQELEDRKAFAIIAGTTLTVALAYDACSSGGCGYNPNTYRPTYKPIEPYTSPIPKLTGNSIVRKSSTESDAIEILNEISLGDDEKAIRLAKSTGATKIVLRNNQGGNVVAAKAIGEYARKNGMTTIAKGECASACVIVFAGGKERIMEEDAIFGLHQCYTKVGSTPVSQPGCTADIASYFTKMGVKPKIGNMASKVRPTDMHWVGWDISRDNDLATAIVKS